MRALWSDRPHCSHNVSPKAKTLTPWRVRLWLLAASETAFIPKEGLKTSMLLLPSFVLCATLGKALTVRKLRASCKGGALPLPQNCSSLAMYHYHTVVCPDLGAKKIRTVHLCELLGQNESLRNCSKTTEQRRTEKNGIEGKAKRQSNRERERERVE